MSKIKVMTIQVGWTEDKEDNLKRAMDLIDRGFEQYGEADILCLPEFYYANPTKKNKDSIGEPLKGPFYEAFAACAVRHQVNIITGTFPMLQDGHLYNTCLAIDRRGQLKGKYSKVHLFDAFDRKESDILAPGDSLGIFDFDFGRAGVAICYELRFPEYLRTLALKEIDLLLVPAAFYRPRNDQWDILVKSAALNSLCYVAAANQYNKYCFGRSQIVDPCGLTLAQASDLETVIFASIDTGYQQKVRGDLAVYENRVPQLYEVK